MMAATLGCLLASAAAYASSLDFAPTTFRVFAADGTTVIGTTRFTFNGDDGGLELIGSESHYNNGSYDHEEDRLQPPKKAGGLPTQLSFNHHFFHADGSPDRTINADFVTGKAACTTYIGGRPDVKTATITFPKDTYAGGSVTIPLRSGFMESPAKPVIFHYFTCMPGPRLVGIRALPSPPSPWNHYPGRIVQVQLQPDFGWLSSAVAAFLPNIRAWLDPAQRWNVVGVETTRYYKGITTLLVAEQPRAVSSSR